MKKTILCILLLFCCGFLSCNHFSDHDKETHEDLNETVPQENIESATLNNDVPFSVFFDSMEEYVKYLALSSKTDDEIAKNIETIEFGGRPEHALLALKTIKQCPNLYIDEETGFRLLQVNYTLDFETMTMFFQKDENVIVVSYYFKTNTERDFSFCEKLAVGKPISGTLQVGEHVLTVYDIPEYNKEYPVMFTYLETEIALVYIRFFDKEHTGTMISELDSKIEMLSVDEYLKRIQE